MKSQLDNLMSEKIQFEKLLAKFNKQQDEKLILSNANKELKKKHQSWKSQEDKYKKEIQKLKSQFGQLNSKYEKLLKVNKGVDKKTNSEVEKLKKSHSTEILKIKSELGQKNKLVVNQEKQIHKLKCELGQLKSQKLPKEPEVHSEYHDNDYEKWRYMVIRCKRGTSASKREKALHKIKSTLGQIQAQIVESDAVYFEETDETENQAVCDELQKQNETLKTERDTLVSSLQCIFFMRIRLLNWSLSMTACQAAESLCPSWNSIIVH